MLILPRLDDYGSWQEAEKDPRATGALLDALIGFQALFGDSWTGWKHDVPLVCQFFVGFQNQAPEGARLWGMVENLRGTVGLDYFVRDGLGRKAWRDYLATVMGLEFCSRARSFGCDVEFIQRDNLKRADARVTLRERPITIEFKALHEHDQMAIWHPFEQQVMDELAKLQLAHVAFDREVTWAALRDAEAVIQGLASIAERDAREYEPLPRETGRARIAPINVGSLRYPVTQTDELTRIASKIRSKWHKQLRNPSEPSLLIVRTRTIFGSGEPAAVGAVARRVADVLEPELHRFPCIGGVLIFEEPFWAPCFPVHYNAEDLRVSIDTSPRGFARFSVFVPNATAQLPLMVDELHRLIGPGRIW